MTRDELELELGRMGTVLRGMPGNTDVYWEALADIPLRAITAGVQHALRTRAWFPTPAEIRHDCDAAKPPRATAVPPTSRLVPVEGARREWIRNPLPDAGQARDIPIDVVEDYVPHCDWCGDTGMVKYWCGPTPSTRWPWLDVHVCQRRDGHYPHDWAGPCSCIDVNPVIQRRKEAQRERYAAEPEKV